MHVASFGSGKEHLKAACSDLEKIRKLKKEAEFLEASFRAKAASLQETDGSFGLSGISIADIEKSDSDEIHRFKLLRSELMELERRVQRSTPQSENEENIYTKAVKGVELVPMRKNENLMGRSLEKLREMSTDVWQGTQLLAIDIAATAGLLQRKIIGDELTEKEKKFRRRTLTDLASVVPTGILMLLPVTAVGHAAILAAIQRYVPSIDTIHLWIRKAGSSKAIGENEAD